MYKLDVKTLHSYGSNLSTGKVPTAAGNSEDPTKVLVAGPINKTTSHQNARKMTSMMAKKTEIYTLMLDSEHDSGSVDRDRNMRDCLGRRPREYKLQFRRV